MPTTVVLDYADIKLAFDVVMHNGRAYLLDGRHDNKDLTDTRIFVTVVAYDDSGELLYESLVDVGCLSIDERLAIESSLHDFVLENE